MPEKQGGNGETGTRTGKRDILSIVEELGKTAPPGEKEAGAPAEAPEPLANGVGEPPVVTAILAAAGVGEKLGGARAFIELGGKPLVWHSLAVLENCRQVDEVVLVVTPDELARANDYVRETGFTKVREVIAGGRDRGTSIWYGLRRADPRTKMVLIHDGARPLVTPDLVLQAVLRCISTGSAVLAIPMRDNVRRIVHEFATEAVDRKKLYQVQTPQVFRFETVFEAYRRGMERVSWPSDHAELVEDLGEEVNLVEGSVENIKITTPEDLELAEAILQCRARRAAERERGGEDWRRR